MATKTKQIKTIVKVGVDVRWHFEDGAIVVDHSNLPPADTLQVLGHAVEPWMLANANRNDKQS